MSHFQSRTFDKSRRAAATTWSDAYPEHQTHFGEVAMALLPASLILATATALLVALV